MEFDGQCIILIKNDDKRALTRLHFQLSSLLSYHHTTLHCIALVLLVGITPSGSFRNYLPFESEL